MFGRGKCLRKVVLYREVYVLNISGVVVEVTVLFYR